MRAWLVDEMLPVGDGHEICVRAFGNPAGVPAVFLHGGPGSGVSESQLGIFDPELSHVFAFDQRGAGLSRPKRGLGANTTWHLVADIEAIRERHGIARWMVVGGSWGATLALAYAQRHPERVLGMVLRAVFLGTRAEVERAFGPMLATFHPGLYADFLGFLPEAERARPLDAYWARILDPDPGIHGPAARAWGQTEMALALLNPSRVRLDLDAIGRGEGALPSSPFTEAHYFSHDCFLADAPLVEGAGRLADIPGVLVQGRYDLLCPPATAHALAAVWPGARVRAVEAAGHVLEHSGVREAVTEEVAQMARALREAGSA